MDNILLALPALKYIRLDDVPPFDLNSQHETCAGASSVWIPSIDGNPDDSVFPVKETGRGESPRKITAGQVSLGKCRRGDDPLGKPVGDV